MNSNKILHCLITNENYELICVYKDGWALAEKENEFYVHPPRSFTTLEKQVTPSKSRYNRILPPSYTYTSYGPDPNWQKKLLQSVGIFEEDQLTKAIKDDTK